MKRTTVAIVLLAALVPCLSARPAHAAFTQRGRVLMGTVCTVEVQAPEAGAARTAAEAALDEIARLEAVMSSWKKDSELARLNAAAADGAFECSADLYAVLDSSLAVARDTGGAFDPTVDPLIVAWDQRGAGRVPSDEERARALALVGWSGVTLDPTKHSARFARAGMAIDLGGIGKGFALERAAAKMAGVDSLRALLNIGGEVFAVGRNWSVDVAHPSNRMVPVVRLHVSDAAVSTSAQSERGVEIAGKRYGHILDPKTGTPIAYAGSVTVVARSGTRADGLTTALFVMGRERAKAFAAAHPEFGVLWLEPAEKGLRAWRWNLGEAAALPDVPVEWMSN